MKSFAIICVLSGCLGAATAASGQAPTNRLPGRSISGSLSPDTTGQFSTETMTLTFQGDDGGPAFTVDFTVKRGLLPSAAPPAVVDITVTQRPVEDDTPAITSRVDGQAIPLITRVKSQRSIVSTIPFTEFLRLTSASSLVENAFTTELEFTPTQLSVLRATADKWANRR